VEAATDTEGETDHVKSKVQTPWSGYWFVNVGDGKHRTWEDNMRYGFIGAGQGAAFSNALKKLKIGDRVFAYMKGEGYTGYGEVTKAAVMIKDFVPEKESLPLLSLPLKASMPSDNKDNPELSEYVVGVAWTKTFPVEQAKTFKGAFANQNIVCKLRDVPTLEFLKTAFGILAQ
jgi:hypothetical protein